MPIYNLVREKAEMLNKVHQINKVDQGATIESIRNGLNTYLNALGLKVDFDPDFLVESVRLRQGKCYSTAEAEEYARAKGSRILRSNLLDDIAKGRLVKDADVRWVSQLGGRGGSWQLREEALERRIAERSKGRGRPRKEK